MDRLNLWAGLDLACFTPKKFPFWVRSGGSQWLFEELSASYGEERAAELCRALNDPCPSDGSRKFAQNDPREALLSSWKDRFGVEPCVRAEAGIRFNKKEALTSLPEFKDGLFEIQDEGSQLVASLVRPQTRRTSARLLQRQRGKKPCDRSSDEWERSDLSARHPPFDPN